MDEKQIRVADFKLWIGIQEPSDIAEPNVFLMKKNKIAFHHLDKANELS